jgi:D-lactate dehydrogenase (cytochrome)
MEILKELTRLGVKFRTHDLEPYFTDESKFRGSAFAVVKVVDATQVASALLACAKNRVPVTVSAGRTSITGASVPVSGIVMDISGLSGFDPQDPSVVGPGTVLEDYRTGLDALGFFYPPDPTSQDSCAIGGNVACNASGALSYLYGPTRDYIQGLEVAFTNGSLLRFKRGDFVARNGRFHIPGKLFTPPLEYDMNPGVPNIEMKSWRRLKNAAGLFSGQEPDLVDLFIGSEGILGVITEIRTRLVPKRNPYFALLLYTRSRRQTVELTQSLDLFRRAHMEDDPDALSRLKALKGKDEILSWFRKSGSGAPLIIPSCMEWFSSSCSGLLTEPRASTLSESYGAIFIEQEYPEDDDPYDFAEAWNDFLETFNNRRRPNESPVFAQVAIDERKIREIRHDRLMVPERLNQLITPGMVKIGTDFATPMENLETVMELYDTRLPKEISYTFGHIGNAHVHSNIVPRTLEQEQEVKEIYLELAARICELGGSVSAEHGIGKLKRKALEMMFGRKGINEMIRVKRDFDPSMVLNQGNIFELPSDTNSLPQIEYNRD